MAVELRMLRRDRMAAAIIDVRFIKLEKLALR